MNRDNQVVDPALTAMRQAQQYLPPGKNIDVIYLAHKTSLATRLLKSEIGRRIYPDALIEHPRLGPLSLLCVRALAKSGLPHRFLPSIMDDPVKMRVYYDTLSVDVPLEYSHVIEDAEYWKRVVMAKSRGKCYAYNSFNWKNVAISLLVVERIESLSAEFGHVEEIRALAKIVKPYVTELHVSRLQSLLETSFAHHIKAAIGEQSDSEDSSTSSVPSESERDAVGSLTELELEYKEADANRREMRKQQFNLVKEERRQHRIDRAVALAHQKAAYSEYSIVQPKKPVIKKKKKKKKKKKGEETTPPTSLFDMEIEPPEEDRMEKIVDARNKEPFLNKIKSYKYPAEHCHHINLNFVRFFSHLVSFTLEFLGPKLTSVRQYHDRMLNFSTKDIKHLAYGLGFLHQLKVFRLRNSRMNAEKLNILTQTLRDMDSIETVDFGYDHLVDDCGKALYGLFLNTPTIKSLELEGNLFGVESLQGLADGLGAYEGTLEYLGLAGTCLGDKALHVLNARILGTNHLKRLSLVGATISQSAIICCIADELLLRHTPLVHLDIGSIIIHLDTAEKLLQSLQLCTRLEFFNCRGCGLPVAMELEAHLVMKKNKFIAENPFVGEYTKTPDELDETLSQMKNPILLRALAAVEKRKQCYGDRKSLFGRDSTKTMDGTLSKISVRYAESFHLDSSTGIDSDNVVVDPNDLTEEQYMQFTDVPGPNNRFRYMRDCLTGRSY